jgi:anti-anti-sigma factor
MKVEQQRIGTVDVLTPVGTLIEQDAERFLKTLMARVRATNPRVVLDMHEVPYMDSAALEGLLTAAEELSESASALKLAGVTATCREILELTGLSARVRFFEDVQGAVKSFL